ncbi:MAG: hypothetical protein KDD55_03055 [Bdellovibrionales bacterium]|nr:hypothetical protein [Bdellovibrionales bacterium]
MTRLETTTPAERIVQEAQSAEFTGRNIASFLGMSAGQFVDGMREVGQLLDAEQLQGLFQEMIAQGDRSSLCQRAAFGIELMLGAHSLDQSKRDSLRVFAESEMARNPGYFSFPDLTPREPSEAFSAESVPMGDRRVEPPFPSIH